MTTVITREPHKAGINKSIYSDEKQAQIRKSLKEAVGYVETNHIPEKKYKSEVHHEKAVPFKGNVYTGVGNSLNTKEIDKRYKQSIPSLWWLVTHSMVAFVRRMTH
jgi:hypothetical protein